MSTTAPPEEMAQTRLTARLRRLLEGSPEVEIVAACADLGSLSAAVDEHYPDVVLTYIRMPPNFKDEGVDLARQLRFSAPGTGVVLLSQYMEADYALRLLEEGRRAAW